MISKTMTLAIVLATLSATTAARADVAAGDACAAKLTADGKLIYAAVVAAAPTLETLRSTMETEARSLVRSSKIARGEARDNAQAAGECVRSRLQ